MVVGNEGRDREDGTLVEDGIGARRERRCVREGREDEGGDDDDDGAGGHGGDSERSASDCGVVDNDARSCLALLTQWLTRIFPRSQLGPSLNLAPQSLLSSSASLDLPFLKSYSHSRNIMATALVPCNPRAHMHLIIAV